ncbi:MAG: hypothetical protein KBD50_02040 [Candidatus Pacebacteria bacterium]|nr:hypothetical protein [Candidatus Paceibacterota bacterium]
MAKATTRSKKREPSIRELLEGSPRQLRHILRSQDFDRALISELFMLGDLLERRKDTEEVRTLMRGRTLHWYGDEASSRTAVSFIKAAQDLGGNYIARSIGESSEGKKGESLEDTILTLSTIGAEDIIALRHPDEDAIYRAALVSKVPVINAGSGGEQHPTQGLLDLRTAFSVRNSLDGLNIGFGGDLKNARASNSFIYSLTKFRDITFYLVSRDGLRIKGELRYYLERHKESMNIRVIETSDLEWVIDQVDIFYQTRAQKERAANASEHDSNPPFIIDRKMAARMKPGARIMHPLPRNEELAREIDHMPQQLYVEQMRFGRIIRRALLAKICHDNPPLR